MIEEDCTGNDLCLPIHVAVNNLSHNITFSSQNAVTSSIDLATNYSIDKSTVASTSSSSSSTSSLGLGFVHDQQQQQSAIGNFGLNLFHPQTTMNFGFNLLPSLDNLNFVRSSPTATAAAAAAAAASAVLPPSNRSLATSKAGGSTKNKNNKIEQSTIAKPRRRLRHYSLAEKLMAVELAEKTSNNQAARQFNVDRKCVREWRKAKDKLISACNSNPDEGHRKRQRGGGKKPMSGELERRLLGWVVQELNNTNDVSSLITSRILKLKAVEIFNELKTSGLVSNEEFKASDGWLEKFLKRHSSSFGGADFGSGSGCGRSNKMVKLELTDDNHSVKMELHQ